MVRDREIMQCRLPGTIVMGSGDMHRAGRSMFMQTQTCWRMAAHLTAFLLCIIQFFTCE